MYEAHSTETVCTYQSYLTCAESHPLNPEDLHLVVLLLKLHHGITRLHVGWTKEHLSETVVFLRIGPCVNRCRELCWHRNWPTWHLFPQMYGVTCFAAIPTKSSIHFYASSSNCIVKWPLFGGVPCFTSSAWWSVNAYCYGNESGSKKRIIS